MREHGGQREGTERDGQGNDPGEQGVLFRHGERHIGFHPWRADLLKSEAGKASGGPLGLLEAGTGELLSRGEERSIGEFLKGGMGENFEI
jgi:hypothetical protein